MKVILNEGEPFFFQRGKTGCLLIHGFTGAPKEMRWLGEHLADEGFSVLGVRLFGHATDQRDLLRSRWQDWFVSVEDGYHYLRGTCDRIVVMGLSLGGSLALHFGAQFPMVGIVACSAPYVLPDKLAYLMRPILPILGHIWRFFPKAEPDWVNTEMAKDHLEYPAYPIRGAVELDKQLKEMRRHLPKITVPVLLVHSINDQSVPMRHATRIYEALGTKDKGILWLENSGHIVVRDAERERVFQSTTDFIRRIANQEG
jgi:carboxylesterase